MLVDSVHLITVGPHQCGHNATLHEVLPELYTIATVLLAERSYLAKLVTCSVYWHLLQ